MPPRRTAVTPLTRGQGELPVRGTPSRSWLGTRPLIPFPTERRFGAFISRPNRFTALIELEGRQVLAHLPNTGRMMELLVPGHPVMLIDRPGPARKTAYDMVLVEYQRRWVSVDSRLPSQLVYQAMVEGALPPWAGCVRVRREAVYGDSRLDLELWRPLAGPPSLALPRKGGEDPTSAERVKKNSASSAPSAVNQGGQRCLVETKSVNLVVDGRALFPDAPTTRGARHLRELARAAAEGIDAAVFFVIQRPDAGCFSPFEAADPEFTLALRDAAANGVGVHAYGCRVSPDGMALDAPVPVEL